jgi:hypothetical protein
MGHRARSHNHTRPDRLAQRQEDADTRQAAYDRLSTQEKLQRALTRGHAGTREALRLAKAQS